MSPMKGEAGAIFSIMVACLALEAIMKDQFEQLNKIGVAATQWVSTKKPGSTGKCEICKICKYGPWHPYICRSVFDLLLWRVWHLCDLPCGVYALFSFISIARYILKSLGITPVSIMSIVHRSDKGKRRREQGHIPLSPERKRRAIQSDSK